MCVNGILGDVAEGRSAIYVDLLGYDEVSHHSGPQRADTLGVLRDIDRQISRIERSFRWAPRPYHLIVLSDHGQTQGEPFEAQHGESLEQIVERLTGTDASSDPDSVAGRTESTAWFRSARGEQDRAIAGDTDVDNITVLGSGSLGLVYLGSRSRLTLEEVDERHPELIPTLRTHPGIGFVMVRSTEHGAMALGPAGHRLLDRDVDDPDAVEGDDPLAPFGAWAVPKVAEVDRYEHVADLMINARYDPETDEVSAFEHQVGSHGGLGGPQTHPFLLYPSALSPPEQPIESAVDLHHVLKNWLAEVGQPAIVREPTTEEP